MLRSRVLAVACFAVLPAGAVAAEALKAEPAATSLSTSPQPLSSSLSPSAQADGRPYIATATATSTLPAPSGAAIVVTATPEKSAGALETTAAADPVKPAAPLPPTLTAQIDLSKQSMVVSENGVIKHTWPISSGTSEFPTPRGTFRPQWVAKMWYSRKYDNAPMPNAVFINGGVAVHATPHVSRLGSPASHGCIRLAPGNAKTFYSLVQQHGMKLTRVSVFGTPKWRAPAIASRKAAAQRYAAHQDTGHWFSSPKTAQPVSAYDPRFTQRRYRPAPPPGYRYVNHPTQYSVYRTPQGQRVVYAQPRGQRRVYYNASGYGYGGGW